MTPVLPDPAVGPLVALARFNGAVGDSAPLADAKSGIQRMKGARSATSTMYHCFFAESQRAPSAFAASFSANGVTKLILIGLLLSLLAGPIG